MADKIEKVRDKFNFIPRVERFCGVTTNLKCGCVLIILWTMIACAIVFKVTFMPACISMYESGKLLFFMKIVRWLMFSMNMLLLICSFVFLFGLFFSIRSTAIAFMAAIFLTSSVTLVFAIVGVVQYLSTNCKNLTDIINAFLFVAVWTYFLFVLNTYLDVMAKEDQET